MPAVFMEVILMVGVVDVGMSEWGIFGFGSLGCTTRMIAGYPIRFQVEGLSQVVIQMEDVELDYRSVKKNVEWMMLRFMFLCMSPCL